MGKEGDGKRPKSKALTAKQWARINTRYLNGDAVALIASDYKIQKERIYQRAKRYDWGKHGSRKEAIEEEAKKEIEKEIKDDLKSAIKIANDESLDNIKEAFVVDRFAMRLAASILKEKTQEREEAKQTRIKLESIPRDKRTKNNLAELSRVYAVIDNIDGIEQAIRMAGMTTKRVRDSIMTERQVLGIDAIPVLSSDTSEDQMDKMGAAIRDSFADYDAMREGLIQNEYETIRAEAATRAEAEKT